MNDSVDVVKHVCVGLFQMVHTTQTTLKWLSQIQYGLSQGRKKVSISSEIFVFIIRFFNFVSESSIMCS